MKVQFRGRRMAFGLGTGNKEAAGRIAAGIYTDLLTLGVEATLAKRRVQKPEQYPDINSFHFEPKLLSSQTHPSTLKTPANHANSGDEQVGSITCSARSSIVASDHQTPTTP